MASSQEGIQPPAVNWYIQDCYKDKVDKCLQRTNWEALCERASRANDGQPCRLLEDHTSGANRLARLLEFQDGTRWVARVELLEPDPKSSAALQMEIDTMALLTSTTKAPVPRVFAFETDDANPTGSAFVLLEFVPGNIAIDELGDDSQSTEVAPPQFQERFLRSMAAAHAQIAAARLPQIGAVRREADGSFSVGPIPGIGGPYDTAGSFIQALADVMKHPLGHDYVRRYVPPSMADEILKGHDEFPGRLAGLAASGKHFTREGPFPVRHPDLFHSNIIVNKTFDVLGVIDWDRAYTVPWELVDAPAFVRTLPRLISRPEDYDEAGQPLDARAAEKLALEQRYASMVREAELDADTDHRLSDILADRDTHDLGDIIHRFRAGKMGTYGRAMDYYENK